jgi:hypothetical protein
LHQLTTAYIEALQSLDIIPRPRPASPEVQQQENEQPEEQQEEQLPADYWMTDEEVRLAYRQMLVCVHPVSRCDTCKVNPEKEGQNVNPGVKREREEPALANPDHEDEVTFVSERAKRRRMPVQGDVVITLDE